MVEGVGAVLHIKRAEGQKRWEAAGGRGRTTPPIESANRLHASHSLQEESREGSGGGGQWGVEGMEVV